MVFSSFVFLTAFLPAVLALHFLSKNTTWRNAVLLAASLFFYAWGEPRFLPVMLASIGVNYAAALLSDRARTPGLRRLWAAVGIGTALAFLFFFKYFAFLGNSLGALLGLDWQIPARTLPIGISFYTFQIITYTADVCRGKVKAQKNPALLALYISFFPQLIAGPIVNYSDIERQLTERTCTWEDTGKGMARFIAGLGKKVLLANVCGEILSKLTLTGEISVMAAWLGAAAFAFQIFFDFSGYSDMAIGLGRMFGFTFRENFDSPYLSGSVTEFWRRWHISLGSFFREYVYIPLGGNRAGAARHILNILIVWILTGAWHGASWNFVVWGLYYAVLLIFEKYLFGRGLKRLPYPAALLYTGILTLVGWVLFYHESLGDGLAQIGAMFGAGSAGLSDPASVFSLKHDGWVLIASLLACLPWKRWIRLPDTVPAAVLRGAALTLVLILSLIFLAGSTFNPFLYFRF